MFDQYFKLLSNTIADNLDLSIARKELEDSIFFEKFYNEEHGRDYYTGVCLTAPIARQNKSMVINTSLYNPIKVRIQELHNFSLPNPCAPDTKDPFNVISRHPIAFGSRPTGEGERVPVFGEIVKCYFDEGPDDFGKIRGIRYEYPTMNTRTDFRCMNSLLKSQKIKNMKFLKLLGIQTTAKSTPASLAAGAKNYDDDSTIPGKTDLNWHIARLHPQFQPYIKSFIYECWSKLQTQIIMGGAGAGFRPQSLAKSMRQNWDNWVAAEPKGVLKTSEVYKKWRSKKPYVAAPAVNSHHNTGTAIDFNPIPKGKVAVHSSRPNSEWIATGVIAIAKSLGLRWGGEFRTRDPVHLDIGSKLSESKRIKMVKEATDKGVKVTDIPF